MFLRTIKSSIKILTLCLLCTESFAAPFYSQNYKTYHRWNIISHKDDIVIEKKGTEIFLKTFNVKLYEGLRSAFLKAAISNKYIKSVKAIPPSADNVSKIHVSLKTSKIELFTFYRDKERKYVLDFWEDKDDERIAKLSEKRENQKVVKKDTKDIVDEVLPKKLPPLLKRPSKQAKKMAQDPLHLLTDMEGPYRDFRYGGTFVWDYEPLSPDLKREFDLGRKTPEFYFKIKDRNISKNDKEAHLQLSINLYRKKKYGLMYKSIKLFEKKYGDETFVDEHDYLKANALMRENLDNGNREPIKSAISLFADVADRTGNYDLKKGIYKYLLAYFLNKKEWVEALETAKKLYVETKKKFDYEEASFDAEVMFYTLSKLNQIRKIKELLGEKTIVKLVPKQVIMAYKFYTLLKLDDEKTIIREFQANKSSLSRPIHQGILFNVAEAYFRSSKYKKSLKLFDQFLTKYSHHYYAPKAYNRLALIYDITGEDPKKIEKLYRNAVRMSPESNDAFEARFRYVGLTSVRNKKPDSKEKELRVLLDVPQKPNFVLSDGNKKLLWQVRLRSYINDKQFRKAISYLSAIPLPNFDPLTRRVFEADGAEAVWGMIHKLYSEGQYPKVIKIWRIYREKYLNKIANDPNLNYIVGQSYLKMGLYDGFEEVYGKFSKMNNTVRRTFPIWHFYGGSMSKQVVVEELDVVRNLKLRNWDLAARKILLLKELLPNEKRVHYYSGIYYYHKAEYQESAMAFEKYLSEVPQAQMIGDQKELADMIYFYTNALYEIGEFKKFWKVGGAILEDTASFAKKSKEMKKVKERISYLMIEILAGRGKDQDFVELVPQVEKFKRSYSGSQYTGRVEYLHGLALIKTKDAGKGRALFQKLLNSDKISGQLKGLIRSELSLLALQEKTI